MAKRSILLNHLENRFKIVNKVIKELIKNVNKKELESEYGIKINQKNSEKINLEKNNFEKGNLEINNLNKNSFDYVVTNPPYKKLNTGKINENEKKLISKHELKVNLNDFIEAASFLLKDKGTLFMVHRPERLADILEKMKKEKIEPKEIRFVYPKINEEPNLILIKGIKNGGEFLKIDKPLYVYKENGEYTDEILKIYQKI